MTRVEKIENQIKTNSPKLYKAIQAEKYTDINNFVENADRYIEAIEQGRMICSIDTVSKSGMSRTLKFMECNGSKRSFRYYNFYLFFRLLGFQQVPNRDTFRVNGCGMDMVFATNYDIIHTLHRLGFINAKECEHLAQQTPTVI